MFSHLNLRLMDSDVKLQYIGIGILPLNNFMSEETKT